MKLLLLVLINLTVIATDINYSKCLETRVYCQSLPADCVGQNSQCTVLLIATPSDKSDTVQFELFGKYQTNKRWFSMAFSEDSRMGNDSVTEIYISNDGKDQQMRQSYNQGLKNQVINEGLTNVTQIGTVANTDGILSGKWTRSAITTVQSNKFDILNEPYNIILTAGPLDSDNKKLVHSEKSISDEPVNILQQFTNRQTLKDIYKDCKQNTDICVGLPEDCIQSENCNLVLTATNTGYGLSSGTVSFQMIGKAQSQTSGWIAMALSDDSSMGSDSVVECLVLDNSTTILRNSWNTDDDGNQVVDNVDGVLQTGPVVYEDGLINCKWTRTAQTKVNGKVFDMKTNEYYILLAKGNIENQKTAQKSIHSEKISSDSAYDLESQQTGTTIVTTDQPLSSTTSPSALSQAYDLCKQNKRLCLGISGTDCVSSENCQILFSSQSIPKTDGTVEIELFLKKDSGSGWSGVALSTDQHMGEDSVTFCILKSDGSVVLWNGWNPSGSAPTENYTDSSGVTMISTSFTDGVVYCKWQRKGFTTIEGYDFNIQNNTFYLLLGKGPLNSAENWILMHDLIEPSKNRINLQSVGIQTTGSNKLKVQLHATFMIIGWLGCVASAILLARHYKSSWPESKLGGVKLWFAFHRSVMVFGVALILTATIIIFIEKGWVVSSAHTIVGLVSIVLCFLQPIGALFRPGPDSPKRWLFNYIHWSGGYIGYLLSFIAICLATSYSSIWSQQSLWILIAYIIVYIFAHTLHHLMTLLSDQTNLKISQRKGKLDTTLAVLNMVIILAFVLALVIMLFK